jgi:3-oxoacyl-[acyl-carrier-protein] synthase II
MQLKRVVVTGIGALTPIGKTAPEYFDSLVKGVSGAAPITRFDASKFKTRFACEVKGFNPEDHFERKEARKIDQYTQFALVAAAEAMKDSSIDTQSIDLDRAGVIWGSGIGGLKTFQDECQGFSLAMALPGLIRSSFRK